MAAFPDWFPYWLAANVVLVLIVRWRAPRLVWWALGAVMVVTFVLAVVWTVMEP